MTFEKLDLCGLCLCTVMVIEPEFSASDALGVGEVFEESCFVFGCFRFDVFGVDAVGGIDVVVFLAESACGFEISRVTGYVDKCLGACDFCCGSFFFGGAAFGRETRCAEPFEKIVKGFARMAFVRIYVAMSIDEHGVSRK